MQRWVTGSRKTRKEVSQIIQSVIPRSRTWALSCVSGLLFTRADREKGASSTDKRVRICSPNGEIQTMNLDATPAQKLYSDQDSSVT